MWQDLSAKQLLALRAVAEEGTFGRAASRLGFTQSAVSQQIAGLERLVGQQLFDRPSGPRAPKVTPAGQLLLDHANGLLEQIQRAEHDLDRYARGVAGRITIGTFQSVSARVLPKTLGLLRLEAPDVEVSVVEEELGGIGPEFLGRHSLDLAFAAGEIDLDDPAAESIFLGADPHVVVVPNDYPPGPVPLAETVNGPLVGQRSEDPCGWLVDRSLESLGLSPNYAFRSQDNGAVQGMVRAGVGLAIMPLLTVDLTDPGTSIRVPEPELPPRPLWILWPADRTLAPIAKRFIELATEVCANRLDGHLQTDSLKRTST